MPDVECTFTVDLQPVGRRARVEFGATLLDAARSMGVAIQSVCGGVGTCGNCRVRLAEGQLSPPTPDEQDELSLEEIEAGCRLACQALPLSDVRLDIPPESLSAPQRLQVEGQEEQIALDPVVLAMDVEVPSPSLHDPRSDVTRLKASIANGEVLFPLPVIAELSAKLRVQNWSARLAVRREGRHREVVAVFPPKTKLLGLAVDIGTTKLAAYLVDLESGETLGKTGAMNPQVAYGEDVISRISYADQNPDGVRLLQARLMEALNQLAAELCAASGAAREQIVEVVVGGNTVMHHLFAGLPVHQLGTAPYVPAVSDSLSIPAREVGLALARGATVYLPPNIAGYVGADHVAMLLATGVGQTDRNVIALDIGTNTEISLATRGRLLSCSCPSGPAFEGAHIQHGMRAASGAIERVRIIEGKLYTYTIGGVPAVGICGSGILDAVAEMRAAGMIDERGNFRKDSPSMVAQSGRSELVLAPSEATAHGNDIVVTREDVNEIQLAKAAIRAGMEALLVEADLGEGELHEIVIAGAFGSYLDIGSAVGVGMFPDLPRERFRQVGNAASMGAKHMLVSAERRRAAEKIARRVEYIELANHPSFASRFARALCL